MSWTRLLNTPMQALLLASPAIAMATHPQGTVEVPVPSPYSYDACSLRQLNLNNTSGRYIGFTGHTVIV